MNYKNIYDKLIIKGQNREIPQGTYKESHHIIPEAMGGLSTSDNLVDLLPAEHLIAHLLLVKIHPDNNELVYAANMMTNGSGATNQKRVNKSKNKNYAWLKEKFSKIQKVNMLGEKNHRFGVKMSDETKQKISESKKGKTSPHKGKKLTQQSKDKMSAAKRKLYDSGYESKSIGFKHSDESKKLMSLNSLGKGVGESNGMFGEKHSDTTRETLRLQKLKIWKISNIKTGDVWIGKEIDKFCEKNKLVKGSLQDVARARKKNPDYDYKYRKVWVCEFVES